MDTHWVCCVCGRKALTKTGFPPKTWDNICYCRTHVACGRCAKKLRETAS